MTLQGMQYNVMLRLGESRHCTVQYGCHSILALGPRKTMETLIELAGRRTYQ
jgi:hypothetical protein